MSNATAQPVDIASQGEFVAELYRDVSDGYLEVRCLRQTRGKPPIGSTFVHLREEGWGDQAQALLRTYDMRDDALTCLGVGVRSAPRSSAIDVDTLTALWVDVDWRLVERDACRQRILSCPLQPSCVVVSGHGYHVYWFLREPWSLSSADRHLAGSLLRRLAHYFGGDLAVAHLGAVLRAPGTLNRKIPDQQAVARVGLWQPACRHNPTDFGDLLPPEPAPELGAVDEAQADLLRSWTAAEAPVVALETLRVSRVTLSLIRHGVPAGDDESAVAQGVICSLIGSGYDPAAIRAIFESTPAGIGYALVKRGRDGLRWLALSTAKALQYVESQRGAPAVVAPPLTVRSLADQLDATWPPETWLAEGLLSDDELMVLCADAGVGKSWIALWVALHLALGMPLWGHEVPTPRRVLFAQEEMAARECDRRLQRVARTIPRNRQEIREATLDLVCRPGPVLARPELLTSIIDQRGPYDVVIVDSLAVAKGDAVENDNDQMSALLTRFRSAVCMPFGISSIILHHTRKPDARGFDAAHAARGASAIKAVVDTLWVLEAVGEWVKLHVAKARSTPGRARPLLLKVDDVPWCGGTKVVMCDTGVSR